MLSPLNLAPRHVSLLLALASAGALAGALIGQYMFGLHPCELCIYQRWPYALVILAGLIGFFVPKFRFPAIALSGLALFVNAAIAFFHSGVERKWWAGLEGCSTPDMSGSIEELMRRIEQTAVTRCDEIAWELFGLSMANYNVAYCLALAGGTVLYLLKGRSASRL